MQPKHTSTLATLEIILIISFFQTSKPSKFHFEDLSHITIRLGNLLIYLP
jgi:hypothetical protein